MRPKRGSGGGAGENEDRRERRRRRREPRQTPPAAHGRGRASRPPCRVLLVGAFCRGERSRSRNERRFFVFAGAGAGAERGEHREPYPPTSMPCVLPCRTRLRVCRLRVSPASCCRLTCIVACGRPLRDIMMFVDSVRIASRGAAIRTFSS